MIPPNLLAQFEADYFGRLSTAERQALRENLQARPDWQKELRQYQQLWRGFDQLGVEHLQTNLADWEKTASSSDETELFEWYFQGQLSPENRRFLEEKQATDPEFAARFVQYRTLFSGLDQLGEQEFRGQLTQWEESAAAQSANTSYPAGRRVALRSYRRVLAIAASILLLVVAGLLWQNRADAPLALIDELYTYPVTGSTLANDSLSQAEYLAIFDQAHQAFQQQDFEHAVNLFTQLSATVPPASFSDDDLGYYQDNVEWMVVLARYGAGQTTGDYPHRLRSIADNATHRFQAQARQLQEEG